MPKIVLSYRRSDSAGVAGRIFDHLVAHYGNDAVYMDIDNIPYGVDFRDHIGKALDASDALLVVVGPNWLTPDETGVVRIREENDFVRAEIEIALTKAIPVIPLLIDRTRMPKPAELPQSLNAFAFRNAADIDSGRDFHAHIERLLRSMDQLIAPPRTVTSEAPQNRQARRTTASASAGAAAGLPAKPDAKGRSRLRWLGLLLLTVMPMWLLFAADRNNGFQAFIDLLLVFGSGLIPSLLYQRSLLQTVLFGSATGFAFALGMLVISASDHPARAPSVEDFLGVTAVTVCVATAVAIVGHAIGALIRRRRQAALATSQ